MLQSLGWARRSQGPLNCHPTVYIGNVGNRFDRFTVYSQNLPAFGHECYHVCGYYVCVHSPWGRFWWSCVLGWQQQGPGWWSPNHKRSYSSHSYCNASQASGCACTQLSFYQRSLQMSRFNTRKMAIDAFWIFFCLQSYPNWPSDHHDETEEEDGEDSSEVQQRCIQARLIQGTTSIETKEDWRTIQVALQTGEEKLDYMKRI